MQLQNPYDSSQIANSSRYVPQTSPATLPTLLMKIHLGAWVAAALLALTPVFTRLPWDMSLLHPLPVTAIALTLTTAIGEVAALVCLLLHRDWRSLAAVLLGVVAFGTSLFTLGYIAASAFGNCPI